MPLKVVTKVRRFSHPTVLDFMLDAGRKGVGDAARATTHNAQLTISHSLAGAPQVR